MAKSTGEATENQILRLKRHILSLEDTCARYKRRGIMGSNAAPTPPVMVNGWYDVPGGTEESVTVGTSPRRDTNRLSALEEWVRVQAKDITTLEVKIADLTQQVQNRPLMPDLQAYEAVSAKLGAVQQQVGALTERVDSHATKVNVVGRRWLEPLVVAEDFEDEESTPPQTTEWSPLGKWATKSSTGQWIDATPPQPAAEDAEKWQAVFRAYDDAVCDPDTAVPMKAARDEMIRKGLVSRPLDPADPDLVRWAVMKCWEDFPEGPEFVADRIIAAIAARQGGEV